MTEKGKSTEVTGSGVGVIGDNAQVEGGIHQHTHYHADAPAAEEPSLEKEIATYRTKAESLYENLPVAGFATHLKAAISLDEMYIPLRGMVDLRGVGEEECFADAAHAEKILRRCESDLEIPLTKAFEQAGKRGRKGLVILGDPGSGKTTHLKRILLWCLRRKPESLGLPENMLPLFLPLRDLENTETRLSDFIEARMDSPHLTSPKGFGARLLDRGNLLFLFDGLDEVADLARREHVVGWIEAALADFPNSRFVVTSRFSGYTPSARFGERFLELHVRPLTEDQAGEFIRNWYSLVERNLARDPDQAQGIADEKATDLIARFKEEDFRSARVVELTRNPLLLTNICLVHRHRGSLPKKRARLYRECIDVLLEHWRGAKKLRININAEDGRRVLQPAAWWLHQEDSRTRATAGELAPVIQPALSAVSWEGGDASAFLKLVRDESGLLTGWDQEHYGFIHLGFQEYLAAREIRRIFLKNLGNTPVLGELADRFGEGWWQEVTLLLLALEEDPCLFDAYMRELVRRPVFLGNPSLVEMCVEEAAEVSVEPFLELLGVDPGEDEDLWRRQALALRVAERMDEEALVPLLETLGKHPFGEIREWVAARSEQGQQDVLRPEPSGYELVWIPGGSFMMGSEEYDDEQPIHEVTLPGFYIGRYPVTNEEYGRYLAATGADEPGYWADRKWNQPNQPVVGVSWHDAMKYAEWASLRLPSEAEWEYACRAGTTTKYSWGDEPDCSRANYGNGPIADECKDRNPGRTSPVGDYPPNPWGLYDMNGNVWEWCEDHFHDNYEAAPLDGSAWVDQNGASRVLRGGSWYNNAVNCRSALRSHRSPGHRDYNIGFRLAVRSPAQF